MELAPHSRIGSFEILSLLGTGGVGAVYRAKDLELGRSVAIKVLKDELFQDPTRVERFRREARAASALNHPNIITIYEIGVENETHFLVMEYVEGSTLREILRERTLPLDEFLELATQIADGLAKAHEAGIMHRDLKPENMMLTPDGLIKILDFGLAKFFTGHHPGAEETTMERQLTQTGVIFGTVAYMSPEQLSDKTVDERSDQFSFGTILYEMLALKRPFDRPSAVQTVVAIMETEPDPLPCHRSVPDELAAMVMRLLAKSPSDRFPSTREVAERLKAARSEPLTTITGRAPLRSREIDLPEFLDTPSDEGESRSAPFFVGRDTEYSWLRERLQKALTGAGQLVFVTGEPGSGKTTLFNEFIRRAHEEHDGLVTAVGHCNAQTGAGDPYLPFREIAHLLTGDVEARREARAMGRGEALRLWHLLPHALATLLKVGPDLIETFVDASGLLDRAEQYGCPAAYREQLRELAAQKASQEVATGVQQSILLEQCAKFIQGLSRRRPLLLVFEDLHWA